MSNLEARAQPFLRPLIAGRPSRLHLPAQAAIAAWAIKTAMVFEEGSRVEGERFYSMSDRELVRTQARPPAWTSVWLGQYVGESIAFTHASDLTGVIDDGRPFAVHLTTFVFRRLVIQIASGKLPADLPSATTLTLDMVPGPWENAALRVWPGVAQGVDWPPIVSLHDNGDANLDRFCDRWGAD